MRAGLPPKRQTVDFASTAECRRFGKAENSKQDMYEFKFAAEQIDAIRIYVTKNNGKNTIIAEVEAYAE